LKMLISYPHIAVAEARVHRMRISKELECVKAWATMSVKAAEVAD
jgi:hypothetical protein